MSTSTSTYTYSHTVKYLTGKLLLTLEHIILRSGLSPAKLTDDLELYERGVKAWLESRHLESIVLEVFRPGNSSLIGRWDLPIEYGTEPDGFWFDGEEVRYQIKKAGLWPSGCDYKITLMTKPDRPDVYGWEPGSLRSTAGLKRQTVGTMISANGVTASAAYWR